MKPSIDFVRRSQRVIRMVCELHRMGYQRLRIMPYEYPLAYRICVAPSKSFSTKNGAFAQDLTGMPIYSSASEASYFNWPDAKGDNARKLAFKFVKRFPEVCAAGRGRDWPYAGWLVELLGVMETDESLPVVMSEFGPDPLTLSALSMRRYDSGMGDRSFPLPPAPPKLASIDLLAKYCGSKTSEDISCFPVMANIVGWCIAGGINLHANPRDEDAHMPLVNAALDKLDNGSALLNSVIWASSEALQEAFLKRLYPGEENIVSGEGLRGCVRFGLESIAYAARDLVDGVMADPNGDWDHHGHPRLNAIHAFATSVFLNSADDIYRSRSIRDFRWRPLDAA